MLDEDRATMRALFAGEVVEFEGVKLRGIGRWQDLAPGDTYIACRNQGPKLLTVKRVAETIGDRDQWAGCVYPVEVAYPYDLGECVKVEVLLDDETSPA